MATDGLTDDFQEINLRDTEIECRTRPESDQVASRPSKIKQIWKRSIVRGHRRHTTTPYVEKELLKCTISGPTNFGKVDLLEDRFKFSRHSIQACPFDIDGYGGLIMRDEFKVSRPKKMNLIVFLFEKIIIFTKPTEEDSFYYFGSIKTDQVSLLPPDRRKNVLRLKDHVNSIKFHKDIVFKLEASSEYTQLKWRTAIERCLWTQLLKAKEQVANL